MTPARLNAWRIVPRLLIIAFIVMTFRVVEWFMTLPEPTLEQAGLVSVMTGALTGAFGLLEGRILGYWAYCTPFNMRDPVGNPA